MNACSQVCRRLLPLCRYAVTTKQLSIGQSTRPLIKNCKTCQHQIRHCSSSSFTLNEYNAVVDDTLEDLADYFDQLADEGYFPEEYDLTLADGVLTVCLGEFGTYVINKQTPNRQLWLSSPMSGPKRYDFVSNTWYYSHEPDISLHERLSRELLELTDNRLISQS